jgi:hypothetical protein
VRLVAAVLMVVGVTAWAPRAQLQEKPVQEKPVAFAVALRTFESQSTALADQAVAQSSSAPMRAAAATLAAHANVVSARIWKTLDQWHVAGVDRLPVLAAGPSPGAVIPSNPTAGLRHACGIVAADELGRLAVMSGTAFDQAFVRDWVNHAQSALVALAEAPRLGFAATAERLMHEDIATLAAAAG